MPTKSCVETVLAARGLARAGTQGARVLPRAKPQAAAGALALLFLTTLLLLAGCDSGGALSIASQNKPDISLAAGFTSGIYRFDDNDEITVVLFDGPKEKPAQVCTIRLFWQSHAGRTPIDPTATNATVHYIIYAGEKRDHVGIYSGAGFVFMKTSPGESDLKGSVWEANLHLTDRGKDFRDLLGPSLLRGTFTAVRDDIGVNHAIQNIDAQLHSQLGYPRMVDAPQAQREKIASMK